MAISWGSYEGHLRVGIDHVISPASPSHSDTSVTVTWKYYVGTDGWNFDDNETLNEGADGWGGASVGFHNGLTSGSMLVGTHSETYAISYSSGTKSASANLSGVFNGATPSHSVTVSLPDRPIAPPSGGENPNFSSITSSSAYITWSPPTDNGGDTVDFYQLQVDDSSGYGSPAYNNSGIVGVGGPYAETVTGLNPNTKYYARIRAHNSAGWGDWTDATANNFTTLSGLPTTPGVPSMTSRTLTSINLGWAASLSNGGGTITYTIDRATNNTFTTGLVTTTTTSTTKSFTGLTAGTTYYFRIKATNTNGSSGYCATTSFATLTTPTYTDSGDYVTLVNNLATAVADRIGHLGIYTHRSLTTVQTLTSGTTATLTFATATGSRGPDNPTVSGTNFTIQYPGFYFIEYGFMYLETVTAGVLISGIKINGTADPNSTNPKLGEQIVFGPAGSGTNHGYRVVTQGIRLAVGDTVAFTAFQNSGSSMVQPTSANGVQAYAKVSMVGF